jgi:hypothetical protein
MKTRIKVNASGLKTMTCMYHMNNVMIEGYYTGASAAKMVYGIGVHKYIDTMFQTKGHIGKAREAALFAFRKPKYDDKKAMHMSDENHFLSTCYSVWEDWVMKDNHLDTVMLPSGEPATEVTFSIPYYEDANIIVDLEGTIDRIAKVKGGCFVINDFKTTGAWQHDTYLSKYAMSQQLRFYVFSLKLMHEMYPDSMLGKIGATNVGACIDGIFLKPKSCDNTYKRSDVFQFNDLIEFRRALDLKIQELSAMVEHKNRTGQSPPKNGLLNGACEGKWGMCNFWNVCKSQSPEIAALLLSRDFKKKIYDPLHHNEEA